MGVWDARTGVQTLQVHAVAREGATPDESWRCVARFSGDGSRIAASSFDRTVHLFDAETGETLAVLRGHEGFIQGLALSPDGSRVFSMSARRGHPVVKQGELFVWDALRGRKLFEFGAPDRFGRHVAVSGDGRRLLTWSFDRPQGVVVLESDVGAQRAMWSGAARRR